MRISNLHDLMRVRNYHFLTQTTKLQQLWWFDEKLITLCLTDLAGVLPVHGVDGWPRVHLHDVVVVVSWHHSASSNSVMELHGSPHSPGCRVGRIGRPPSYLDWGWTPWRGWHTSETRFSSESVTRVSLMTKCLSRGVNIPRHLVSVKIPVFFFPDQILTTTMAGTCQDQTWYLKCNSQIFLAKFCFFSVWCPSDCWHWSLVTSRFGLSEE